MHTHENDGRWMEWSAGGGLHPSPLGAGQVTSL